MGLDRRPDREQAIGNIYLSKYDLSGRVAVITGGGRNIGLACAHALAEAGATVVITGRAESETAGLGKESLAGWGYEAHVLHFDVTNPDNVNDAAQVIAREFGGADILVCNSGAAFAQVPAESLDDQTWLQVMDLNLNGLFWCCRAFGRQMLEKGKGSIVTIGSISGEIVNRPQPQCDYNVSKAGVHHLTRCLAAEWADRGVRVNAVAPTYIDKPRPWRNNDDTLLKPWLDATPMRRQGECHEVASVVLFLASDASSLMTGSIVLADGGYTCW